jgi:hypothetical protein
MGIFGDIFRTVTAPARFVAKSPIGDLAKMAAPVVMGPGGIAVSAGIGALEKSDEGVGDMLGGAATSGAQGAASYGMGKGVGALIGKGGGAGAGVAGAPGSTVDPSTGAMIDSAIGSGRPGGGVDPSGAFDQAISGAPAGSMPPGGAALGGEAAPSVDPTTTGGGIMSDLGLGEIPPWLKWSMLLKGASGLGQLGYGIYDNERARKRGARFGDYLSRTAPSRPPPGGMY